ncbi:type II 3-dehydroquinate dehydratase [Micrococcoides hystricis]|uniref:3-dehydroquinate dehydratase n=1 Tax=Micrococcoides hystricis TaxID=1572761 RepID=A0ABV6PD34_9MICC
MTEHTSDKAQLPLLVINGPNLNMLGTRNPEVYGRQTLTDVEQLCRETGSEVGYSVDCFQANSEGAIIDRIHAAHHTGDAPAAAIVINPGAYSHTSVAIRDALEAVELPVFEVHISNIHAREEFRHHSFVSAIATAVIAGAGINGYRYAVEQAAAVLAN